METVVKQEYYTVVRVLAHCFFSVNCRTRDNLLKRCFVFKTRMINRVFATEMLLFKSFVVLTATLMVYPLHGLSQHLVMRDSTFYKLEGKALVGNVTTVIQVNDHIDCSFLCLEQGPFECLSFNVGRANNNGCYTCELSNSERHLREPLGIQDRPGYDYYGRTAEVRSYFFL